MSSLKPSFQAGVDYWEGTEATVNGVLGGYGATTPVPRLDAASSRLLILSLLPALSTIVPPHHTRHPTPPLPTPTRSFRALDCGAGIGRVTQSVLLPLFHRVDLVDPVLKFVEEAKRNADSGKDGWKALSGTGSAAKGVRMWVGGLQRFDPAAPAVPVRPLEGDADEGAATLFATVGSDALDWPESTKVTPEEDGYDLVMIQWCVGHLSDEELVTFLQRSKKALRRSEFGDEGYIIVKENICRDEEAEGAGTLWDEEDSSITRSDKAFRKIFVDAGLTLVRREIQQGFPKELFPVIAYALR